MRRLHDRRPHFGRIGHHCRRGCRSACRRGGLPHRRLELRPVVLGGLRLRDGRWVAARRLRGLLPAALPLRWRRDQQELGREIRRRRCEDAPGVRRNFRRRSLPLPAESGHGLLSGRPMRRGLLVGVFRVQPLPRGDQRLSRQRVFPSGSWRPVLTSGNQLLRIRNLFVHGDTDLLRGGNVAGPLSRPPVRDGFGELRLLLVSAVEGLARAAAIDARPASEATRPRPMLQW